MKAAGRRGRPVLGILISVVIILAAVALGDYVRRLGATTSYTDATSIDTEVVHVAALVGGRVIDIPIKENSAVKKGDLLFQIDPQAYQIAVQHAQAALDVAKAALETKRRAIAVQKAAATIAETQTTKAQTNMELAQRTVTRLTPLAARGFVPTQQLDQAQTTLRDTQGSFLQAQQQQDAAVAAIDTDADALAAIEMQEAQLAEAQRNLRNTTVRAPSNGRIVGLSVAEGETIIPSQALFTLVNTDEWHAVANFRETDLKVIHPGQCATVFSMLDNKRPIEAVVESIGAGVKDTGEISIGNRVPFVERSLNWVRVAQRFPVRLRLIEPPPELVRLGASAVVEIRHDTHCD